MKAALLTIGALLTISVPLPLHGATPDEFAYCTVCHGAHGNGNLAIRAPKIAAMESWYIEQQLRAFRAGWRGIHTVDAPGLEMRPVARVLEDDAAITRAVAYVGTFEAEPTPTTVRGDAQSGATLYAPCAACHGVNGEGNESMGAPALRGQNDWYLVSQLINYRERRRGAHADDRRGAEMRAMVTMLTDDAAINDVVAHINTLR